MPKYDYDVIFIGTSNHALAGAAYLGKDLGLKCLMLERRAHIGAAAMTREIYPGYRGHVAATGYANYIKGQIVDDLDLEKRGVEMIKLDPWLTALFDDGTYARIWEDPQRTYAEMEEKFGKAEADGYMAFRNRWAQVAMMMNVGIAGEPIKISQLLGGLDSSTGFMEIGRDLLFTSLQRGMGEFFSNKKLVDMWNLWLEGVYDAPSAPGTLFAIVGHLLMNEQWTVNKGGLGKVAEALASAAVDYGAEIRCNTEVVEILTEGGKAYGVKTADGEIITAKAVVSNAECAATVDMVGEDKFDADYVRKARNCWFEACGNTISFALKAKPHFTGMPDDSLKGFIGFNCEREKAEKAFYQAHVGIIPEDPLMIGFLISEIDKGTYAPEGGAVLTVYVFPNTWDFADGSTWKDPKNKQKFYDNLVNSISKYSPDFKDLLLAVDGFTPGELQDEFGMTRGDHQHGLTSWGFMMGYRPIIGQDFLKAPIKNLYYVGAPQTTTGISGYGGLNLAKIVEQDWAEINA